MRLLVYLPPRTLRVAARRVQVSEALWADPRVPKQQSAVGAPDDVIVPARLLAPMVVDVQ
jgi:hypothetical protein